MEANGTLTHSTLDKGYNFYLTDKWGNEKHFKIATLLVPSGLLSEAIEVIKGDTEDEPRVFHVLSDIGADIEKSELKLKGKVKKGINRRYLKYKDGDISILDGSELAGRILSADDLDDSYFDYFFQVDGKILTVAKFVDLLKDVEGWNFKFQILDTTDDID